MAEAASPVRDEVYRRLRDAAAALASREGVRGVRLVSEGGRLVMAFGSGPQPEAAETLARLDAAVSVARTLDPENGRAAPVYVHDGRNRIYARAVARDLSLWLCCETRLPPGLAYRLVEAPVDDMREALSELFDDAAQRPDPGAGSPCDDDIFWE
jgi:hypothetical protein